MMWEWVCGIAGERGGPYTGPRYHITSEKYKAQKEELVTGFSGCSVSLLVQVVLVQAFSIGIISFLGKWEKKCLVIRSFIEFVLVIIPMLLSVTLAELIPWILAVQISMLIVAMFRFAKFGTPEQLRALNKDPTKPWLSA